MKVLNHPNIGENPLSFLSSLPTARPYSPHCSLARALRPMALAFRSPESPRCPWGSPDQNPAQPLALRAVLRGVAAPKGTCPWEGGV